MPNNMYTEFITFFQRHKLYNENTFRYLRENIITLDYRYEANRSFIGCYCINNNGLLKEIKLIVPFLDSRITVSINIHEYIHALIAYGRLHSKYKIDIDCEILPMLYEKIYFLEHPCQELEEHEKRTKEIILTANTQEYMIALNCQEELLSYYQKGKSFHNLNKKAKQLSKKYK